MLKSHSFEVVRYKDSARVLQDIQETIGQWQAAVTPSTGLSIDDAAYGGIAIGTLKHIAEVLNDAAKHTKIYTHQAAAKVDAVDSHHYRPGNGDSGRPSIGGPPTEC